MRVLCGCCAAVPPPLDRTVDVVGLERELKEGLCLAEDKLRQREPVKVGPDEDVRSCNTNTTRPQHGQAAEPDDV